VNDIARLFGGEIVYVPERKELKHSCASIKKAEELLDWKPLVGLEEGIQRFKTFYGV
jgi:nucleoside-diphosphate-sugar epimerase